MEKYINDNKVGANSINVFMSFPLIRQPMKIMNDFSIDEGEVR